MSQTKRYIVTVRSSMVTVEGRIFVEAESVQDAVKQINEKIENSDDDFSDVEWEPRDLDEIDIYEILTPDGKHMFVDEIGKETK